MMSQKTIKMWILLDLHLLTIKLKTMIIYKIIDLNCWKKIIYKIHNS